LDSSIGQRGGGYCLDAVQKVGGRLNQIRTFTGGNEWETLTDFVGVADLAGGPVAIERVFEAGR
jgi:hypothetical protein